MIFVKFELSNADKSIFFVGSSEDAILKDTRNGAQFGFWKFKNHKVVSEEYVRKNKGQHVDDGIEAINNKKCSSYCL